MSFSSTFIEIYRAFEPLTNAVWNILILVVPLLVSMAYLVYAERRIIGAMQLRTGPVTVGPFGLMQPFADFLKLVLKEIIIPSKADAKLFLLAPIITFSLAMVAWSIIPFGPPNEFGVPSSIANVNVGVTYYFAVTSLSVYGIIIAGWASNSKYPLLGALRSTAQMISYEVAISFALLLIIMYSGSLNLTEIIERKHSAPFWFTALNLPMMLVFLLSILAETNRHPFDLPEAEAELVAGYNTEYSSMPFALFYLGEYINMILSSAMFSIFFLDGYYPPINVEFLYFVPPLIWLVLKICLVLFVFIWLRAALPRYRYDQLMRIGWKFLLPFSLIWILLGSSILYFTDSFFKVV